MGRRELEELCGRKKSQTVKLIEVTDLTRQIAEALDRRDEVAAQLLLSERERPVRELSEQEEGIRAYLLELPEEQAIRLNELLSGGAAETEEEKPLAEETARFRRLLEALLAFDRETSIRFGGSRSFYKKFRE